MRVSQVIAQPGKASGGLGTFERHLSVWIALCTAAGVGLDTLLPVAVAGQELRDSSS